MSRDPTRIPDDALMAYLDRSLDEAHAAEIGARLADDPDAQARLAEWRRQNALIAAVYGPAATEPRPARLDVRRIAAQQRTARQSWQRMAATALLCLGLGLGGGWYLHASVPASGTTPVGLMAEALNAHQLYASDIAYPVQLGPDKRADLAVWLSKRLDHRFAVPDLASLGWQLVGGSLVPAGAAPAGQIMYEDANGRRLTLFFTANHKQRAAEPRFAAAAGLDLMSWTDGGLTCTIVGPVGRDGLRQIAGAVYQQLT
ncbi:anti-sigma factor family protein [Acidisoma sp. 7E03]